MKCFINFVNQENGEEDAYRVLAVPTEAEHQMDAWVQNLIQEMQTTKQRLDEKFGAAHSLLIIVKDGAKEILSVHAE